MQKYIPYVVITIIALSAAALLLMPRGGSEDDEVAPAASTTGRSANGVSADGKSVGGGVVTPRAIPEDEQRPPNKAEVMLAERQARPFNVHVNYVAAWWGMATMAVKANPELAAECSEMSVYLRDMSKLNSDQMNPAEVLAKEEELIAKLRGVQAEYNELDKVLDYLSESAKVAREGGDPAAVVKPEVSIGKR